MAIKDGYYRARAKEQMLTEIGDKETPAIEIVFEIADGENKGGCVKWTGWLSEKAAPRTIGSLGHCGWRGEDLGEFADGALHGLDKNEVQIVVELEEYEKDGEKRVAPKVQWVNRAGPQLNVQNAMPKEKAQSFGEKMRALVLRARAKAPANNVAPVSQDYPKDDPIPF